MKGALVKKIPASATLVFIALSALAVLLNHSGLLAPRPGDAPPLLSYGDPSAATLAELDALEAEAAASGVRRAALCITGPVRSLLLAPVYRSIAQQLVGPLRAANVSVDVYLFLVAGPLARC